MFFSSGFSAVPETEYKIWNNDLSCYVQSASQVLESRDGKAFFELETWRDILVFQNNVALPLFNLRKNTRYIPFRSSIEQNTDAQADFKNLYTFWNLDTSQTREIVLEFVDYNTLSSRLNFSHSSEFYTPEFYISEDWERYSQISKNDINDFQIQKLKIIFQANSNTQIREVIRINTLNIERLEQVIQIHNIQENSPVKIYYNNSCSSLPQIPNLDSSLPWWALVYNTNILQENIYYTLRKTDSDWDSIQDLYDNCVNISNRDQRDINQNGMWDVCEFDTDGDSIPDEIDNCRALANPLQEDDDDDNIGNTCDNCKLYNPDQRDENTNGIWDTCEQAETYLLKNDDDADWVINSQDNCPNTKNADQIDTDNDWVWDICDNCKTFQNTDQLDENKNWVWDICEDSDNDGIESLTDNCPNTPNPNQSDTDNDGIWNLCEDNDNDGVIFIDDNCPYITNRNQLDTDWDAVWDACDTEDNRFLESNKEIFIILMFFVILWFVWWIITMARKIQK